MPEAGPFVAPDPGELRWRVQIQENQATTSSNSDSYGDVPPSWVTVATRWAKVEVKSGRRGAPEVYHAEQTEGQNDFTFTMRYWEGLTQKYRIAWRGKTINLNKVANPDNLQVWHVAEGTENVAGA